MPAPTASELLHNDGLKSVRRESYDDWRHGCRVIEVFNRAADDTYWQACYRRSTDGETHGLADGDYGLDQVEPFEKTITDYRKVEV